MNQFKTWCKADNNKLKEGDIILYDEEVHTIKSIRYSAQGIMQSITTETHHINPSALVFTTDLQRIEDNLKNLKY